MTNRYDLAGRLIAVTDGTGTRTYAYDALGRLAAETNALAVIARRYDALGRDAGYDLAIPGYSADTFAVRCDYDAYGRLDGVTSILGGVTNVFRYSYLEGSAILSGMTNGCGVGWSRTYESHRDLVAAVSNHASTFPVSTFVYDNDAAGRRIRRVDDGVSTNMFAYNRRSEVTGAVMGARAHSYGYDGLGNRLGATNDGVATLYRANLLNQYTNILRASAPPRETSPAYDPDGSMVANGAWSYTWDAENRLIGVASNGIPVFTNAYDYMNRRVTKTTATRVAHFIWDGWNIVAEIVVDSQTGATNLTRYVWGLDLSGALQGAGGVGGLLAVIRPEGFFYPCYDANGNITDYVNAVGTVVAHYEYSPFGEITAQSGILAGTFAFRFSTKYHDAETGQVMYQLRPYSPTLGRWISRDPVEEEGGPNLYGFVGNRAISIVDTDGRQWFAPPGSPPGGWNAPPNSIAGPPKPPPHQHDPCANGFCVVGSLIEQQVGARLLQIIGIQHVDIFYNGHMVYLGRGGGDDRLDSKRTFVGFDTYPLSKAASGHLKYGATPCKKCPEATDADILDCLRKRKPSPGTNCQGDVQDATRDCCLRGFRTWVSTFFYWAFANEQ